jgi:hypothetical protein
MLCDAFGESGRVRQESWCDSMDSHRGVLLLDSLARETDKSEEELRTQTAKVPLGNTHPLACLSLLEAVSFWRLRDQRVWWPCAVLSQWANRQVGRESTQVSSWGATAMTSFVRDNGAGAWLLSSSKLCLLPVSSPGILDDRFAAANDVLSIHMPHGPRERTSLVLPF